MKEMKNTRSTTLSEQIRDKISLRIWLTIFLSIALVLFLSIHDYQDTLKQIERNLASTCENMEDFVISQNLVSNNDAINLQINHLNQQNPFIHFRWNPTNQPVLKKIKFKSLLSWVYFYPLRNINGQNFGFFELSGSLINEKSIVDGILNKIIFLLCFLAAILFILYPMIKVIPYKLFIEPIHRLMVLLQTDSSQASSDETIVYCNEIEEIKKSMLDLIKKSKEVYKKTALAELSVQVAHDIRSPLAALNVLIKQTQNIPENQRIMIRNAAQQINKIANNLLERYRAEKNESQTNSPEILSLLLDTVVSEKLAQYADAKIKIDFDIHPDSHGVFCNIAAADFKRVISNLINNAIEAMHNQGNVSIKLSHQKNLVKISIVDSGIGMPQELIQKIMSGESASSKKTGHGIGLASAKIMIETWDGKLDISSKIGKGTTIDIYLPLVKPAEWFADKLNINQNGTIIILDDDQSIHDVWESRFEIEIPNAKLNRAHYYNPEELLRANLNPDTIYLCDYELLGHSLTGLDVIEKLNLKNAVLVTSRYDETEIRARCQKIGIKILPKSYAIYIPLIIQPEQSASIIIETAMMEGQKPQQKPDLILIDDNEALTEAWKLLAQLSDKNIVVFNSSEEADKDINNYPPETIIYIDSDLGEHIKGEDYAKTLYEKGYKNLYLATGYESSKFDLNKLFWIKKVVSKEPQFD